MPHIFDIPINHTLDFILPYLQGPSKRILEVGCGEGHLAQRLAQLGHSVIAIDASEKAVAAARSRGVDARLAEWPAFHDDPFDAILFVRSLHHISPLDAAVRRAAELLRSTHDSPSPSWGEGRGEGLLHDALNTNGVVIIEDFAFDEIDARTAEWLRGIVRLVSSCGALIPPEGRFLCKLLTAENPLDAWLHHHQHSPALHTAPAIARELNRHLNVTFESSVSYLYRYLTDALPNTKPGATILKEVLDQETHLNNANLITPIGRRFACRHC